MQPGVATRTFQTTRTASDQSIESGEPIIVYGMVVSATVTDTVDFEAANNPGVAIKTITVAGNTTVTDDIVWLADAGLVFPAGLLTTQLTVHYRPSG